MSSVQKPNIEIDWREADIREMTAYPDTFIAGFAGTDELEAFSRLMGAQIASIFMTGGTDNAEEYLHSTVIWSDGNQEVKRTKTGRTISERLHDHFAPLGNIPLLGTSQTVLHDYSLQTPNHLAYKRPEVARSRTWIDRACFATATEILAEDQTTVTGYAGLKYIIKSSPYNRNPSFTRTFATGVALAKIAKDLYPLTTTFAFDTKE